MNSIERRRQEVTGRGFVPQPRDRSPAGCRGSRSLAQILAEHHRAQRSLVAHVGGAAIHLLRGEIVHAEVPPLVGRQALKVLLASASGAVRFTPFAGCEQTVDQPFDELMAALVDELRRERSTTRHGIPVRSRQLENRQARITGARLAPPREAIQGSSRALRTAPPHWLTFAAFALATLVVGAALVFWLALSSTNGALDSPRLVVEPPTTGIPKTEPLPPLASPPQPAIRKERLRGPQGIRREGLGVKGKAP